MPSASLRVLIISASIGGGHVAAGRALADAFAARGHAPTHVDLLDYTTAPFRRLYRQTYFDLVRTAPDLVEWLGRRLDREPSEQKGRQARARARLTRLVSYHLPRLINRHRPDLLLHTHFLPPEILSARRARVEVPQGVVVTDFVAHNLWLQPNIQRYFVASEEIRVHLAARGIERERVRVTGIPIDRRFAALPDRAEARRRLGLAPDRDLLLLMAGGMEPRTATELVRQLVLLRYPLTALVICGRSQDLVDDLSAVAAENHELVDIHVMGFSRDIPDYMAAADLLVGKPGGLTSSEALAAALPFAVVQPYPLQEEGNANYLLERGAALRIEPLTVFGHKVVSFMSNAEQRGAMREAALKLARPHAATDIVLSVEQEPL